MATVTRTRTDAPESAFDGVRLYKLDVGQFQKMIDAGIFPDGARVELLGGVLAEQMTRNPPHDYTVGALGAGLQSLLTPAHVVREEKTVILGPRWRPEPDLAVAVGPLRRYQRVHPHLKDLVFLVEVSESTYDDDRGLKWVGYAEAKVPYYWIVNLERRAVEVYSNPVGRGKSARYRDLAHYGDGDSVPVVVDGRVIGAVAVADILPQERNQGRA